MDRILIVDDEPFIRETLSEWLKAAGYVTQTAHDGSEALRLVPQFSPDLLLLDLVMPGMTGLGVCQALKSSEATSRFPVVILSGVGTTDDRVRCLDAGAEEFLNKPVDREELMARVRSLLRSKHLSDRLLMSYYEMDKLGSFAEAFVSRSLADLKAVDVATSMAMQVLGPNGLGRERPVLLWGGMSVKGTQYGLLCYLDAGKWKTDWTDFPHGTFDQSLKPWERAEGQYVSRDPPPAALRELLHIPQHLFLPNFVALSAGVHGVFVAGYPWEVGLYEIPLLKAMLRHWQVFERIRYEGRQTEKAFTYTMEALALAAEFYDPNTASHIRRVSAYAEAIALKLGREAKFVRWLTKCAQMHDVGKITIPLEILHKPGPLDATEIVTMRRHTLNGAQILGGSPYLGMARNIALSHHENFDGSGYPDGLSGKDIPLEARIVKVVDIYDALRTFRSYKRLYSHKEALETLRRGDERVKPSHLDPEVMAALEGEQALIGDIFETVKSPGKTGGKG